MGSPDARLISRSARHFPRAPWDIVRHFLRHRDLITHFTRREVLGKSQGSFFGPLWSVLEPLLLLAIYTFVFGVLFKGNWDNLDQQNWATYGIVLFSGLVPFSIFAQSVAAAPQVVTANPSYVTRVVFPLEILPVVRVLAVTCRMLPAYGVLLAGMWIFLGPPSWTVLLLPVVVLPMICYALAATFFLACLGVFVRDLAVAMALVVRVSYYLSPVFYPLSRIPAPARTWIQLNPLAGILENCRGVMIYETIPNGLAWGMSLVMSMLAMWLGYALFMSLKRAFADVI